MNRKLRYALQWVAVIVGCAFAFAGAIYLLSAPRQIAYFDPPGGSCHEELLEHYWVDCGVAAEFFCYVLGGAYSIIALIILTEIHIHWKPLREESEGFLYTRYPLTITFKGEQTPESVSIGFLMIGETPPDPPPKKEP